MNQGKVRHSSTMSQYLIITITYGDRGGDHCVETAALERTVEVGDHSLHVLRPLGVSLSGSALGRTEILDAELDLLGVVARLAEGDNPAEVVGHCDVVSGTIRSSTIASPLG